MTDGGVQDARAPVLVLGSAERAFTEADERWREPNAIASPPFASFIPGISGGIWGLTNGYGTMVGGDPAT